LAVKESIINEEIVLATMKDNGNETKDTNDKDSTAFVTKDHSGLNCHYCGIKGHIQPDCRKKKKDEQQDTSKKSSSPKGKGGKGQNKQSYKGKKGKGKQYHNHNRQSND
jgi:hypothetical protein